MDIIDILLSSGGRLSQIDFLLQEDISFANTFCSLLELDPKCSFRSEAMEIACYNNHEKGIIEKDFFLWALAAGVSYDTMRWFIEDFSKQTDRELLALIKAFYKKYRIYLDESNNPVKFKLKNDFGDTNVSWFDDFVLAGIVLDEGCDFDIESLFESFRLQKNVVDAKLGNIASYNGEKPDRLLDILKSDRVKILLESLNNTEGMYIHWSTQSLWYYSLVDLVDSTLEMPLCDENVKNALFDHALDDPRIFSILAQYDYPNIAENKVRSFCGEVINWIECLTPKDSGEEFFLECLRQGIKTSRRFENLPFLKGNKERVLIDSFLPNYALRMAAFPNSLLVYDECTYVQDNIETFVKLYCTEKTPCYSFASSTNNKWIQLADMMAGLTGALMAYVNTHDKEQISEDLKKFSDIQHYNLGLFLKLRVKSSTHNIFFDNMSRNHQQIDRIKCLMQLENVENGRL